MRTHNSNAGMLLYTRKKKSSQRDTVTFEVTVHG